MKTPPPRTLATSRLMNLRRLRALPLIAALLAALLLALYFPFALYAQVLLSETLFITLLLGGFLALAIWTKDQRPTTNDQRRSLLVVGRRSSVVIAGVLFGLATLTRSLTLLF